MRTVRGRSTWTTSSTTSTTVRTTRTLLLRTSLNDAVGVPSIDFSSIVVATDRDGDEITLNAGSFTIAVQDDIPVS